MSCRRQFFGLGNPAWDLVYFLVLGSVDPAEDAQLLAEYHATLVEGDAPGEGIRAEYSLVRPVCPAQTQRRELVCSVSKQVVPRLIPATCGDAAAGEAAGGGSGHARHAGGDVRLGLQPGRAEQDARRAQER